MSDLIETPDELLAELAHWTFHMPGWTMTARIESPCGDVSLHFRVNTMDTYHPERKAQVGHVRFIPVPIPRGYLPHRLRDVVHSVIQHEADEWLKHDGAIVFNPHERGSR